MPQHPAPRNLRDLLRAEPRLAPARAARLLREQAAELATRGARGEAHGALTPERVLLDAAGRATLAPPPADDGGLAPWPAYLAPEQLDGKAPDPRSDVYAVGLLGWEMLSGHTPWAGESLYRVVMLQREQDLPRISTLRPGLPRELIAVVEGALHKHPGDRWRDAGELLRELQALDTPAPAVPAPAASAPAVSAPAVVAPAVSTPAVSTPAVRRRPRALALAALTVAVLGAGVAGLVAVQGRDERTSTQAWLDSITGGATGEVVAESALLAEAARALDAERREARARRVRQFAQPRRDSLARLAD
ncbi:hypothetical protein PYV61_19055, partial [Roseisolibacter sp. H3M3-2]|nr:hypothetical protein [Roseisolibacter sp. H3M3-2]